MVVRTKNLICLGALAACVQMFWVSIAQAGGLEVDQAFARAVPPGAPMGAVYARLQNTGKEGLQIVNVYSDVAAISEIHESLEIDGMMRMRKVEPFLITGSAYIDLLPGGKHVMLMRLKRQLKKGDSFKMVFVDAKGREYEAEVQVGGYGQMTMPKREKD